MGTVLLRQALTPPDWDLLRPGSMHAQPANLGQRRLEEPQHNGGYRAPILEQIKLEKEIEAARIHQLWGQFSRGTINSTWFGSAATINAAQPANLGQRCLEELQDSGGYRAPILEYMKLGKEIKAAAKTSIMGTVLPRQAILTPPAITNSNWLGSAGITRLRT